MPGIRRRRRFSARRGSLQSHVAVNNLKPRGRDHVFRAADHSGDGCVGRYRRRGVQTAARPRCDRDCERSAGPGGRFRRAPGRHRRGGLGACDRAHRRGTRRVDRPREHRRCLHPGHSLRRDEPGTMAAAHGRQSRRLVHGLPVRDARHGQDGWWIDRELLIGSRAYHVERRRRLLRLESGGTRLDTPGRQGRGKVQSTGECRFAGCNRYTDALG